METQVLANIMEYWLVMVARDSSKDQSEDGSFTGEEDLYQYVANFDTYILDVRLEMELVP